MLGYTKHSPRANRSRSKVQNCPHCTPPGPVIQRWRESFLSLPSIWFVIMQLQVALEMNQWHKVLWEGKNRYRNYGSPWQLDLKTGILPVLHKIVMVHTEITLPFVAASQYLQLYKADREANQESIEYSSPWHSKSRPPHHYLQSVALEGPPFPFT